MMIPGKVEINLIYEVGDVCLLAVDRISVDLNELLPLVESDRVP
jgi:hypothetical protein